MKYSTKLSDTVHVMVLIAINKEKSLSSASIAENQKQGYRRMRGNDLAAHTAHNV